MGMFVPLLTGDITNFSLPGEFRQAADWLATLGPTERISLVFSRSTKIHSDACDA